MGKAQLLVSALSLVLLLTNCAPTAAPIPAPQAPAPAKPAAVAPSAVAPSAVAIAPAKPAWEVEWERVLKDAKSEGSVVIYTSASASAPVRQAFKAAYGISAEFVVGVSASLSEKVLRERRAGLYLVDLATIGGIAPIMIFKPAGILQPLDDMLILPDATNSEIWRGGGLNWTDPAHITLSLVNYVSGQILVNRDLVKPEEVKSWRDLLNPKWKNRMVIGDVTLASGAQVTWAHMIGSKVMGWDYMRELVKQEPIIVLDAHLQHEWVARGKYSILLSPRSEMMNTFLKAGAPLAIITPAEGAWLSSGSNVLGMLRNTPNPNAAKLFVNWVLTKEGQTVYSQALNFASTRVDVSTAHLNPVFIPDPKVKYAYPEAEENLLAMPESAKKVKEIWGPLLQR